MQDWWDGNEMAAEMWYSRWPGGSSQEGPSGHAADTTAARGSCPAPWGCGAAPWGVAGRATWGGGATAWSTDCPRLQLVGKVCHPRPGHAKQLGLLANALVVDGVRLRKVHIQHLGVGREGRKGRLALTG